MRASRLAAVAVGLPLLLSGAGAGFTGAASAAPAVAVLAPARAPAVLIPKADFGGVTAVSAKLAWAVGSAGYKPVIERWNGATWQQVPSPSPAAGGTLLAVTAASARSAWAAGESGGTPGKPSQALIEHWNGTRWKVAASPASPRLQTLAGVAASSAKDAWAVGLGTGPGNSNLGLIRHWNGTAWS